MFARRRIPTDPMVQVGSSSACEPAGNFQKLEALRSKNQEERFGLEPLYFAFEQLSIRVKFLRKWSASVRLGRIVSAESLLK